MKTDIDGIFFSISKRCKKDICLMKKRARRQKCSLSRGTLSEWVTRLEGWELVEVDHTAENQKDKIVT